MWGLEPLAWAPSCSDSRESSGGLMPPMATIGYPTPRPVSTPTKPIGCRSTLPDGGTAVHRLFNKPRRKARLGRVVPGHRVAAGMSVGLKTGGRRIDAFPDHQSPTRGNAQKGPLSRDSPCRGCAHADTATTSVITVALVAVGGWIAYRQLRHARDGRADEQRPFVVVDVFGSRANAFRIEVMNLGKTIARSIKISLPGTPTGMVPP
jgi:hypothetical protein